MPNDVAYSTMVPGMWYQVVRCCSPRGKK